MNTIQFEVHGTPKGQPRPRAFALHGRARVFDPGTAEGWKAQIAIAAKPFLPSTPYDGPLKVCISFSFIRPKGHYGKRKGALYLRDDAPFQHTGKPDLDNLEKAVLDALTTLGMWHDDAQVFQLSSSKHYCEAGYEGANIQIEQQKTSMDHTFNS
jgi:Holliday junction resolvase RusA-like endonuclease